jgi:hypothetical protein
MNGVAVQFYMALQKNLWVKQCPDSGKTLSSKGVTVFQP